MKKLFHVLFSMAVTSAFVLGVLQFVPDIKPNVGWNGGPTASLQSPKITDQYQPMAGWNS